MAGALPGFLDRGKGRQNCGLDIGNWVGLLWWWFGWRMSGFCESNVRSAFAPIPSSSFISSVKLLSGSLSHENPGNQFGHASPVFTIIFLVVTAVMQIICLNRGLKVYDSTLVVPVFYGVYTATGYARNICIVTRIYSLPASSIPWSSTTRWMPINPGPSSSSSFPCLFSYPEWSFSRTKNPSLVRFPNPLLYNRQLLPSGGERREKQTKIKERRQKGI